MQSATERALKILSGRKQVNRRILWFSILSGWVGVLLTLLVYGASAVPFVLHWRDVNLHGLSEIMCTDAGCDTRIYSTDLDWEPDYVIDARTRYCIDVATPTSSSPGRFPELAYSDGAFIAKFRTPMSYTTPDNEIWRLYSRKALIGSKILEIIVGYALKAPSKPIIVPESLVPAVDAALGREAEGIARRISTPRSAFQPRDGFSVDGFQVVDPATMQVVEQGPWLPAFLPATVRLPKPGLRLYTDRGYLYAVQTETNGRLSATSFVQVGNVLWIRCSCFAGFLVTGSIARALSHRFLRNYFAISGIQLPSISNALKTGEGQNVEFKRGLSSDKTGSSAVENELLRSIAAFANTNDGVIILGVDDAGHIKGLQLDYTQRDRLERKVHQLARTRIRPVPPMRIAFDDFQGFVLAKIAVAQGEAPPYMINGTIYIRHGSSDVRKRPAVAV